MHACMISQPARTTVICMTAAGTCLGAGGHAVDVVRVHHEGRRPVRHRRHPCSSLKCVDSMPRSISHCCHCLCMCPSPHTPSTLCHSSLSSTCPQIAHPSPPRTFADHVKHQRRHRAPRPPSTILLLVMHRCAPQPRRPQRPRHVHPAHLPFLLIIILLLLCRCRCRRHRNSARWW